MHPIQAWFFIILQFLVPKLLITNIIYYVARIKNTVIKNYLIQNFIKIYNVNVDEIKIKNLNEYNSFNAFFTRELEHSSRPIEEEEKVLISSVDGKLSAFGNIKKNQLFQAKSFHYSLQDLLGNDNSSAEKFIDGNFATIYLAPFNYHRVHAPLDVVLKKMHYIPGNLFSVNQVTASRIPKLFIRNERLVCYFDANGFEMIIIFVGAMNVGSITTPWTGEIRPIKRGEIIDLKLAKNISTTLKKGDLLGWFNMGSTVITLLPKNSCVWTESLKTNDDIFMGNKIGSLVQLH